MKLLRQIDARKAHPPSPDVAGLPDRQGLGLMPATKPVASRRRWQLTDRCNPFRLETVAVLERAKELCPRATSPTTIWATSLQQAADRAMAEWSSASPKSPRSPAAWRTRRMGTGCTRRTDQAVKYLGPSSWLPKRRSSSKIDQVYEARGEDVQVRYDLLKSHHDVQMKRYSRWRRGLLASSSGITTMCSSC